MWMNDSLFLPLLSWYLILQLIGWAGLPFCARLFPLLPDRGYAFSRCLGLLLGGYVYWAGYAFGLWANAFPGAWVALFLTAAAAGWLFVSSCRSRAVSATTFLAEAWHRHKGYVLALEVLFLVCFVSWALVRMEVPGVRHTEQFRNMMFLSGISNSPYYPPPDPWLSGFPVCYYYFAYWVELFPARMLGMPADLTFNVGQACWFALLVTGCFGMGYNLTASRDQAHPPRNPLLPFAGGILSALCVALASNAKGIVDALGNRGEFFWWWAASRAVTDEGADGPLEVITEFPIFSYILGDNHPHVLVMPFTLLILAAAFQLLLRRGEPRPETGSLLDRLLAVFPGQWPGLLLVLLLPAAVFAMNSWDYPVGCAVLVCACFFSFARPRRGLAPTLLLAGLLLLAVPFFFFPYLLTSQSMFQGLVWNRTYPTSPAELLQMFGLFLPGLLALGSFFLAEGVGSRKGPEAPEAARPQPQGRDRRRPAGESVLLCAEGSEEAEARPGKRDASEQPRKSVIPGGQAAGGPAAARRVCGRFSPATFFAILLLLCGLALVALPEVVYVLDVFESRMNTIFKLYYQAWLLLGLASAYGLTLLLSSGYSVRDHAERPRETPTPLTRLLSRGCTVLLGACGVLVVCAGLLYPARAIHSRAKESPDPRTLDGSRWLRAFAPDDLAAVDWIRKNTQPADIVAEAPGTSYDVGHNRASTLAGRATLLGWQGHVVQFRGEAYEGLAAGRPEALQTLYLASDKDGLDACLRRFDIRTIYLGPHERATYGITREQEETLDSLLEVVFQQGAVKVYRAPGER